ncbi:MAG: DUF2585 domain-containing protein [Paracoccaceae bacterium]|nr:DUF2585 domain-containing protein [Paracoccaceae bacterium]
MTRDLRPYWITACLVLATALILYAMGRVPICTCGYVKLWHGQVMSGENSQHLADWYTPSHLLHGLIFYWALWLVVPRLGFGWRLAAATLVEAGWEVLENSDLVIERYRTVTMALDYFGDSVVNSTADVLAMVVGFYMARWAPVWVSLATIVGFEVLTAFLIRDGLALNVVMLLWPIDAVLEWQSGLQPGG